MQVVQGRNPEGRFSARHCEQALEGNRQLVRDSTIVHECEFHSEESLYAVPVAVREEILRGPRQHKLERSDAGGAASPQARRTAPYRSEGWTELLARETISFDLQCDSEPECCLVPKSVQVALAAVVREQRSCLPQLARHQSPGGEARPNPTATRCDLSAEL